MTRVAVIMAVYNCKNYDMLLDSVKSIINQSFEDFEFLICNDGSDDGHKTEKYLERIKKLDPRISIYSYKINKGPAYARNYCISKSNSEYIAIQDDDDRSRNDRLEKEFKFLDNHSQYDFVGSIARVYNEKKVWGIYTLPEYPERKNFLWNSPFANPTIMFRRNVFDAVGGYRISKETKVTAEDYDLFMRLYSKGYKGYNIQETLYDYRIINDPKVKYRKIRKRYAETIVRCKGFKQLKLGIKSLPYIVKPLVVGLIPQRFFYHIKNNQYQCKKRKYK